MGNFREIGSDFWNNKYLCDLKNKLNFNERKKDFCVVVRHWTLLYVMQKLQLDLIPYYYRHIAVIQ